MNVSHAFSASCKCADSLCSAGKSLSHALTSVPGRVAAVMLYFLLSAHFVRVKIPAYISRCCVYMLCTLYLQSDSHNMSMCFMNPQSTSHLFY